MARRPEGPRVRRRLAAASVLLLEALLGACRSDVVVRVSTRVYEDGSVSRRVDVTGRRADESKPPAKDWLRTEAGIRLARPEAWARREESTGRLFAEGTFPSAADVPPALAFETDAGQVPDGAQPALAVENLVILRRWVYTETYADPFGAGAIREALDRLAGIAADALADELHRQMGSKLDTSGAERFVKTDARNLVAELLDARGKSPGEAGAAARRAEFAKILARRGIAVAPAGESGFWDAQQAALIDWSRRRVADALSRPDAPVSPEALEFWPTPDDWTSRAQEVLERRFGSSEELDAAVTPAYRALSGYYGDAGSPRFRFELALEMPGRVLATSGAPGREAVLWFLRDEDLGAAGRTLEAESVALDDEKLRALGARRELDTSQLLQLTDILARRDPDGALKRALAAAVEKGRLSLLREKDAAPEALSPLLRELADLLDPAVPPLAAR